MDPEELDKLQEIEKDLDLMYDKQARKLYQYMVIEGEKAFEKGNPMHKFLKTDLFERLIAHFEETEEYEKCAYVVWLTKVTKDF
jgi:hypothetical protein